MHHVFDLWIRWWRKHRVCGEVVVIRYADDFVIGFERKEEAERCLGELRERFAKFGLKLHEGKKLWLHQLRRRSQRHRWGWERFIRMSSRYLPKTKVLHPYPSEQFRARLKAGAV